MEFSISLGPIKTVGVRGLEGRSEKENKESELLHLPHPPTFAHYLVAKVGKQNLLKHSISLVHMPQFLMISIYTYIIIIIITSLYNMNVLLLPFIPSHY